MLINIALIALCSVSFITDIKYRKVPNKLTYPLIVSAFLYHGYTSGLEGIKFSAAGLFLGFVLLIIPFMFGGMGGGDIKYLMAAGALGGPEFTLKLFIYTGLIGGVVALALMLKDRILFKFLKEVFLILYWFPAAKLKLTVGGSTIPYAVCLSAGTLAALIMPAVPLIK